MIKTTYSKYFEKHLPTLEEELSQLELENTALAKAYQELSTFQGDLQESINRRVDLYLHIFKNAVRREQILNFLIQEKPLPKYSRDYNEIKGLVEGLTQEIKIHLAK